MKFLCDNCKAKYQIADEKVAGKTVRMKCRKCGHLIEVKAAVTETSVAKSVPPDNFEESDHTVIAPPPSGMPATLKHSPAPPARHGSPLGAAKPAPRPSQHPPSALAGAFQKSVHRDEGSASRSLRELAGDQWYVAINGVPVGPIRMSELRRKAAIGAVTEDSLVWQEGLEEWRALRTYPELADAVREAATSGRASLTPGPPERISQPPRAPMAPSALQPPRAPHAAVRALTPGPATARSNVVPITSRLATAEKLEEPSPYALDPFSVPPAPSRPQEAVAMSAGAASAGLAPPVLQLEQKGSVPWIPIAMLVLAACFGVTAAYAIFFRTAPVAPAPVVIVSASPAATPTPTAQPTETITELDPTDPEPSPGSTHRPGTGGGRPTPTGTGAKPIDPAIAALLRDQTGGGPSTGPGTGGGGGGGAALTSDQIEAVVRNHQASVKVHCWQRINTQTPVVNVTAHVQVGPTGTVQSVDSDGNDPMVAKCIENSIRGWQFPPTGSSSTVNIPFHFLRQ